MINFISNLKLKVNILLFIFFITSIFYSALANIDYEVDYNIRNQKLKNVVIKSNGTDRSFLVYTPQNFNPNQNNKVVFMFHGTSQNGMKMFNNTAWNLKADQENFLIIYPNSLSYYLLDEGEIKTRWNDGNLKLNTRPHTILADDVQFFKDILIWTESYIKLKNNDNPVSTSSKVFVCGFSNGAMFCSKLLREASDKITAAGLVSSALPMISMNFNSRTSINPIPTILIYGTKDQRVLTAGKIKPKEFPKTPNDFQSNAFFKTIIDWHLKRNNLSATFSDQIKINSKYKLIYNQPKNGISDRRKYFEIQVYKGLEHKYPINDTKPTDLNATDIFNEFFNKY